MALEQVCLTVALPLERNRTDVVIANVGKPSRLAPLADRLPDWNTHHRHHGIIGEHWPGPLYVSPAALYLGRTPDNGCNQGKGFRDNPCLVGEGSGKEMKNWNRP